MKKVMILTSAILAGNTTAASNVPITAFCDSTQIVVDDIVQTYGENPMLEAQSVVEQTDGKMFNGYSVIWVNGETGSWSFTFTPDSNPETTCLISSGFSIQPYVQESSRQKRESYNF